MRSASLYTGMLAALVGGTWAILRAGAELRPALDVSGRWEACGASESSFEIRQSGKFLRLSTGDEVHALEWRPAGTDLPGVLGEMVGADVRLTLRKLESAGPTDASAPTHVLESHGALEGTWEVQRRERGAPRDDAARAPGPSAERRTIGKP